jgi:hypothetical protein
MSERKIITLCGSTKFKEEFEDARFWLTMQGHIVLTVGGFHHSTDDAKIKRIIEERKTELDALHKDKIDLSDSIMVIDVDNYIGESTRSEIAHAVMNEKTIYSYTLSKHNDSELAILFETIEYEPSQKERG